MDYLFRVTSINGYYYLVAVVIFCITILLFGKKGRWNRVIISAVLIYVFLVFASTVLDRRPYEGIHLELTPFWSYQRAIAGSRYFQKEVLLNIGMLFPVGILMPIGIRKCKGYQVVFSGFCISLMIETLQLITKTGLFEFDDLFGNTLGVLFGYLFYQALLKIKAGVFKICKALKIRN